MTNKSEKLIDKCLEIEGLLSLINQRGENIEQETSGFKEIHSLLLDKAETLLDEIRRLSVTPSSDNTTTVLPPPLPEDVEDVEEESSIKVVPPPIPLPQEDIPIEPETTEPDPETEPEVEYDEPDTESEATEPDEEYEDQAEDQVIELAKPRRIQFSINDKFRFRRELFNFSDEEMEEAIDVACQMNTVEEIEDYFYNDLCFDPENEDVIDFIKILTSSIK